MPDSQSNERRQVVRFLAPQPILHVPVGKTDLIYFAEQPCKGRLPITANKALGFERITFIHMHHCVYEICVGDKCNSPHTSLCRRLGEAFHAIRGYEQLSDSPSID